jgi:Tol biopolymer transport system component
VDSAGNQQIGSFPCCPSDRQLTSISADGRFVAFVSDAQNLVPGAPSGGEKVYVHDRLTGITERVSVDSVGNLGDRPSSRPWISSDGRFVAFFSLATNLVPGDTNGAGDVFVYDRQTRTTERMSVDSFANQGDGDSFNLSISADGRFVAFDSVAINLVSQDTNGLSDVFVHDRRSPDAP